MAEVYGLFSGRDGKVRYVGRTNGTRQDRLKSHLRFQSGRTVSQVRDWIHGEWEAGFPVESALLQACSNHESEDIETEWIARFPNLLNQRKRGWYGRRPPIIPEIKRYQARFIFNVNGFHSIHWWRDLDRYSVFRHNYDHWYWLPGDGAPGWTGDVWFSDITTALKARDRVRAVHRDRLWPRDIEPETEWPIYTFEGAVSDGESWPQIEISDSF